MKCQNMKFYYDGIGLMPDVRKKHYIFLAMMQEGKNETQRSNLEQHRRK